MALTALARLAHRGAVATDGASSDGIGLMTAIPRALLLDADRIRFQSPTMSSGVGMVFLPPGETRAESCDRELLESQDLRVLGWRDVPTATGGAGRDCAEHDAGDSAGAGCRCGTHRGEWERPMMGRTMERRLYLARKQFERAVEQAK